MQAFLELADGGVVPTVLPAARRVFGRMLDEAAQNPDPEAAAWVRRMRSTAHAEEAEAEAAKIAAVLARWQTNGFFFTPSGEPAAKSPAGWFDLNWEARAWRPACMCHACTTHAIHIYICIYMHCTGARAAAGDVPLGDQVPALVRG